VTLEVDSTETEAEKHDAQWIYNPVPQSLPLVRHVDGVYGGRSFTIRVGRNAAVEREIRNLPETARQPCRSKAGLATDPGIPESVHTVNGTEQDIRLIVPGDPPPNLFETDWYVYHALAGYRKGTASEVI